MGGEGAGRKGWARFRIKASASINHLVLSVETLSSTFYVTVSTYTIGTGTDAIFQKVSQYLRTKTSKNKTGI
jgi:hypothetical protein